MTHGRSVAAWAGTKAFTGARTGCRWRCSETPDADRRRRRSGVLVGLYLAELANGGAAVERGARRDAGGGFFRS